MDDLVYSRSAEPALQSRRTDLNELKRKRKVSNSESASKRPKIDFEEVVEHLQQGLGMLAGMDSTELPPWVVQELISLKGIIEEKTKQNK